MARKNKVSSKSIKTSKGKSVSKAKGNAINHARGHSRSLSTGKKAAKDRTAEHRERLNRATRLAIELHRDALKDLESH